LTRIAEVIVTVLPSEPVETTSSLAALEAMSRPTVAPNVVPMRRRG
jgi:hypothetical protein